MEKGSLITEKHHRSENGIQYPFDLRKKRSRPFGLKKIKREKRCKVNLITGCAGRPDAYQARHVSFSEIHVGKNATFTHHMMHKWNENICAENQSAAVVEENGTLISNHVIMKSAKKLVSNPITWLEGKNATAKYHTVILSDPFTSADLGGVIYLNAENTGAEIVHRAVSAGGDIIQRGLLVGNAPCKAHVDCAGMVFESKQLGNIASVPGLKSLHPDAMMSHEASIGKISPKQVEYLRCRGISELDAISMIVRGFINSGVPGIGPEIDDFISEIVSIAGHGEGAK
jgi:Fe-S cluster assembly scaffold protein SufB